MREKARKQPLAGVKGVDTGCGKADSNTNRRSKRLYSQPGPGWLPPSFLIKTN